MVPLIFHSGYIFCILPGVPAGSADQTLDTRLQSMNGNGGIGVYVLNGGAGPAIPGVCVAGGWGYLIWRRAKNRWQLPKSL